MNSKQILFLILLLFLSDVIFPQNKKPVYNLSHPVKSGQENIDSSPKKFIRGTDNYKVVAILVQFQPDTDPKTTGDGLFDLSDKYYNPSTGRDTVVDAPPYDSSYFADHLEFLKNYFSNASKGKVNISYDLYSTVINLPNKMESYSPQKNQNNAKLGNLFNDSWARADSFINFSKYDPANTAFVIFHAGVGRDIDLISVYGYDPTPYDIPSVYLGPKNLLEIGNSGYLTSDGFRITNSMIIPSTELRELQLVSGTFLVELGVNGIFAASFGSYLGLPDLFNTSNGKTAIGRFGLMDGQSLFSYNGIFPPEPSAWEKIFLGWVEPVVISSDSGRYKIPSSSKNIARDSTIFKVLINSKEYFLIENRNRDPENNGQTIYSHNRQYYDSAVYLQDLENGFFYSNAYTSLYLLNGNITDVENFDWSLPGLINQDNNYKGGILIWHIDENVIDSNLIANTVNNNITRRGVDLEEAKGAQEIGVTYNTYFGPVTGDGTAVDYWFYGYHQVPTYIYLNSFSPTSNPNSLSYSLTNNNIVISGFTVIDTLMEFSVSVGSNQIRPLKGFPVNIGLDTTGKSQAIAFDFTSGAGEEFFVNSRNNIFGFNSDGSGIKNSSGILVNGYGKYIPSQLISGKSSYLVSAKDFGLGFLDNNNTLTTVSWDNSSLSSEVICLNNSVYTGKNSGVITKYSTDLTGLTVDSASAPVIQFSKKSDSLFTYITNSNKYLVTGNILSSSSTDILTVNNNNEFFINGSRLNLIYPVNSIYSSPVLADVNSDGKQEIIFNGDNKIYALNSGGVLIDNFPFGLNSVITSGISVADVNNDNVYDLLFVTSSGDLYAYGVNGNVVPGFPVSVGPNTASTPALANLNDTLGIIVAGGDGYLYAFKTGSVYNPDKVLWKNYLKDSYLSNNDFSSGNVPVAYSGKLPSDRVYNWPNPVYGNETYIRYYLNGSASSVNVKILDLSGELLTTLKGTVIPNADNEVQWNSAGVQSGIYFAVVEAVIDGSNETQIIKMAVVK